MFSLDRISRIYKYLEENPVPDPHPAGSGLIQLTNGREITGTWTWHADLGIARVADTGGRTWIIDLEAIVAFSPVTATAITEDQQPPAQS